MISWEELLGDKTAAGNHILEFYDDDAFLVDTVSFFARAGFRAGEGVVLVATPARRAALRQRLTGDGFRPQELEEKGGLVIYDAEKALVDILGPGGPSPDKFEAFVASMTAKAARGRPRVRWWGEMVDLLWRKAKRKDALMVEALFDAYLKTHPLTLLHCVSVDTFSNEAFDGETQELMKRHSHSIPVSDFSRFEAAVDLAVAEALGPAELGRLHVLVAGDPDTETAMPAAARLLLWVKKNAPGSADRILQIAREYYRRKTPAPGKK